jgi:LysM repeat protein
VLDTSCPSGSGGTGGSTPVPGATSRGGGGASTQVTVIPNTPKPDGSLTHIVQPGETLWSLAITYKTTIAQLKALNNLADETIYPGDTLIIARAADTPTPTATPTETPFPTATPFVFRTATRPPEATGTPIPAAPVTGGSGVIVVGVIVIAALVLAGGFTAAGARRNRDKPRE